MSTKAAVAAAFAGGIAVAVLGVLGTGFLEADVPGEDVGMPIANWEIAQANDGNPLATVRGAEMTLWVGCAYGAAPGVVLHLHNGGSFANVDVSIRWGDGTPVDYLFSKTDDSTLGLLVGGTDFLGRLRQHDTILIGAERARGPVRELFSLRGAGEAVAALPCGLLAR